MRDRRMLRTLPAIVLALLLAVPVPVAAAETEPVIEDAEGDASVMQVREEAADIHRVWVEEADGELVVEIEVQDLENTSRAALEKMTWTVRFGERDRNWSVVAAFDETGRPVAEIQRDGETVDAETGIELGNRTVTVNWTDYENGLEAGVTLDRVYAYSRSETLEGDAQCHGETVADCAPNEGYGRNVVLAGAPPSIEEHGLTVASDRARREADPGETVAWTVHVDNHEDRERSVVLNTTLPDAYQPELSRDSVTLPAQGSADVDLEATVPEDAADGTVVFTTGVAADAKVVPLDLRIHVGSSAPASVAVDADHSVAEIHAGETATYELTVTNEADHERSYNLMATGPHAEWVELDRSNATLAPGNSTTVEVRVDVPSGTPTSAYNHLVAVESADGQDRLAKTFSTVVRPASLSEPVPGPGSVAALAALAGAALALSRRD